VVFGVTTSENNVIALLEQALHCNIITACPQLSQ
jgi:hypothetical protein